MGGDNLWGKGSKCLGQYFSKVKIVLRIAFVATESNIPLLEKARELGGRVNTKQNGPFGLVGMADNCNNSYLKTFKTS